MQNEILINATPGETRVALLEKNQFVELHLERARNKSVVGRVVKGRVTRVLPGMQAAFVDIGLEKAAFLYAGDYVENIEQLDKAGGDGGGRGRRRSSRHVPNIETLLREGQEIVVQIAKEPIGTKGARITSHVSVAGRHLVLTPWAQRVGVSRRIDSDRERRRLREIVNRVKPDDLGFIIRTAGESVREADLQADVNYLTTVWDDVQIGKDQVHAPAVLYDEPGLALRVIRDFANSDTKRIVVDSAEVYDEMKAFVDRFVADPKPRIERYEGKVPIFDHYGAEAQIDANLGRKVWLKSGGYLIIDQSEALTAIDVNTGRYVGKRDLEETVLRTNLEAVREVVHQLRFRNIGGLIIIDLIDMESAENRDKVNRSLQEAIKGDKARTNILKISELGLVEMTRKRTRENLVQMLCEPCPYCEGKGFVVSDESMAHKVLREIEKDLPRFAGRKVAVTLNRRVASQLLGPEKGTLAALEQQLGREIEIRAKTDMHQEQFEIQALEDGEAVEFSVSWLEAEVEEEPEATEKETPARADESRSRGNGSRPRRGRRSANGAAASDATDAPEAVEPAAPEAVEPAAPEATEPAAPAAAGRPEPLRMSMAELIADDPGGAEPAAAEPSAREPVSAEPASAEPAATEAGAAEETASEPAAASPEAGNGEADEEEAPKGHPEPGREVAEAGPANLAAPPQPVDAVGESPILRRSPEEDA